MTLRPRIVTVMQLPEVLDAKQGKIFFRELANYLNINRPRIVFDCSNLQQMNHVAVHLLLCCLEEAMKRNGDIKLAAISQEAKSVLDLTGAGRLFKIFDTTTDAVNSYRSPAVYVVSQPTVSNLLPQTVQNVA